MRNELCRKKVSAHNYTDSKGKYLASNFNFVVNQTSVFQIKFCVERSARHVAINLYGQTFWERAILNITAKKMKR